GAEILVDVLPHFGVVQGAHTERFGVVSGEARVFKVARDVQHEDQLLFLQGLGGGALRCFAEFDRGAVGAALALGVTRGRFGRHRRSFARAGVLGPQLRSLYRKAEQAQPGGGEQQTTHFSPPWWPCHQHGGPFRPKSSNPDPTRKCDEGRRQRVWLLQTCYGSPAPFAPGSRRDQASPGCGLPFLCWQGFWCPRGAWAPTAM